MKKYNPNQLSQIVFDLKLGKAIIVATDTIPGILAIEPSIIYRIKNRPSNKQLITFINNINYISNLTDKQKDFINHFWPGQVTFIVNDVSYRFPDNEFINNLLNHIPKLYSSSANVSGCNPIKNFDEAIQSFDQYRLDCVYIDAEINENTTPSSVVNLDNWTIIREGAKIELINEYLKEINND